MAERLAGIPLNMRPYRPEIAYTAIYGKTHALPLLGPYRLTGAFFGLEKMKLDNTAFRGNLGGGQKAKSPYLAVRGFSIHRHISERQILAIGA